MIQPSLTSSPVRRLSLRHADQLWLEVLARQGLAGGPKLASALDVAESALGLHAARLPSPYATLLARVEHCAAASTIFRPQGPHMAMTTVRCMRKTLHTLPVPLAATAHAATRHFRERDALRLAHNIGFTPAQAMLLVTRLVNLLIEVGPLDTKDIETRLSSEHSIPAVRAALKLAWERGDLTYLNRSAHWNRERRVFAATREYVPQLTQGGPDRAAASNLLIQAYFERYGPASIRDATWWSGLSRAAVVSALQDSGRPVVGVTAEWAGSIMYMFEDAAPSTPSRGDVRAIDFLAHEDVALKAYFETRRRYLADVPSQLAFNQIGEVHPVIVRGGRVIGRWAWDRTRRRVTWSTFASVENGDREECRSRADEMTDSLLRHYDDGKTRARDDRASGSWSPR